MDALRGELQAAETEREGARFWEPKRKQQLDDKISGIRIRIHKQAAKDRRAAADERDARDLEDRMKPLRDYPGVRAAYMSEHAARLAEVPNAQENRYRLTIKTSSVYASGSAEYDAIHETQVKILVRTYDASIIGQAEDGDRVSGAVSMLAQTPPGNVPDAFLSDVLMRITDLEALLTRADVLTQESQGLDSEWKEENDRLVASKGAEGVKGLLRIAEKLFRMDDKIAALDKHILESIAALDGLVMGFDLQAPPAPNVHKVAWDAPEDRAAAARAEFRMKAIREYAVARTAYKNERFAEAKDAVSAWESELDKDWTINAQQGFEKARAILESLTTDDGVAISTAVSKLVQASRSVPDEYVESIERDIDEFNALLAKRTALLQEERDALADKKAADVANDADVIAECDRRVAQVALDKAALYDEIGEYIEGIDRHVASFETRLLDEIPAETVDDHPSVAARPASAELTDTHFISQEIKVRRYKGGYTDLAILGKLYPVIYTLGESPFKRPAIGTPATMPTQAIGVCYFHTAMHIIMNNEVFVRALLKHLDKQIKSNEFARQRYESDLQARKKRGLKTNVTMSRPFDIKKEGLLPLFGAVEEPELYMFARNVLLRQTILTALERKGFDERGSRNHDSKTVFMLKSLQSVKARDYEQNIASVNIGHEMRALVKILELSALQVKAKWSPNRERGEFVIARIPDDGAALVVVTRGLDFFDNTYNVPDMGEGFGGFSLGFATAEKSRGSGHAISYQRDDDSFNYVDSNDAGFRNPTYQDLVRAYNITRITRAHYYPSYTTKMATWPFDQSGGTGSTVADMEELELLTPVDANVLTACDGEVCSVPDDVRLAVEIVKHFSEKEQQTGGGSGPRTMFGEWLALASVIVAVALC